MSPASITAFSTIVFGLTLTPMMTNTAEPTSEQGKPAQHRSNSALTYDNQTAERGSRREREIYEGPAGPSMLEVIDEQSPYGRRIERPVVDHTNLPVADEHPGSSASSNASSASQTRSMSNPARTSTHTMSSPSTSTNTSKSVDASNPLSASPFAEANNAIVNSMRSGKRSASKTMSQPKQSQQTSSQSPSKKSAATQCTSTTQQGVTVTYDASSSGKANTSGSKKSGTTNASMPGRRAIEENAAKIPAPGSNLGNAKVDQSESSNKNASSKQAAPSASAGQTDKE